ncbi:MAG: hypothetical protein ACUVR0_00560 [Candidatus Aminicenantales bacterium]
MDELNLKDYLPEVKAPADFEKRVLAAVAARQEKKKSFFRLPRLNISWQMAALTASLVLLVTLSLFILARLNLLPRPEPEAGTFSSAAGMNQPRESLLTLTEPVNFYEESSGLQRSKVIYILEPVDDRFLREIKY